MALDPLEVNQCALLPGYRHELLVDVNFEKGDLIVDSKRHLW